MYASQSASHPTSSKQSSQELKRISGALWIYIQSRTREKWMNLRQYKINRFAWQPNSHTNQESKCRIGEPHELKFKFQPWGHLPVPPPAQTIKPSVSSHQGQGEC
jgi:hypothetical protein